MKNDLEEYMKFKHIVSGAYWNADEGLWHVKVIDDKGVEFEDTCNVFLNRYGILKFATRFCMFLIHAPTGVEATGSGTILKAFIHSKESSVTVQDIAKVST